MAWRDQRNALSDHLRDHMDDELVHLAGIKERGNKLAAADQPNILAFLRAQPFGERGHVFANVLATETVRSYVHRLLRRESLSL